MSTTETRRDSVDVGARRRLLEDDPEPDPDHSGARRTRRAVCRDPHGVKVLLIALTPILYHILRTLYGDAVRRGSIRAANQLRVALTAYRQQHKVPSRTRARRVDGDPIRLESTIRDRLIAHGVPPDRAAAVAVALLGELVGGPTPDRPHATAVAGGPDQDAR